MLFLPVFAGSITAHGYFLKYVFSIQKWIVGSNSCLELFGRGT